MWSPPIPCSPVPIPGITEERHAWVRKFRAEDPTPTLPEMAQAIANPDPGRPERSFAYWQKWCWETEDLPIGLVIGGMVDGRSLTPEEVAAYDAPFPDPSYKMGPRAMPTHVSILPGDPSTEANEAAWKVLESWDKPFLCAFADNDPVTRGAEQGFIARVPGAKTLTHPTIQGGSHFLQEGRGVELATIVADLVASTPDPGSSR